MGQNFAISLAIFAFLFNLGIRLLNESAAKREAVAAIIESQQYEEKYSTFLTWGLDGLHSFFGKGWSFHALDRCMAIGCAYGFFFFMFAWTFGFHGGVFDIKVFPVQPMGNRVTVFVIILIFITASYLFWRRLPDLSDKSKNWVGGVSCIVVIAVGMAVSVTLAQGKGTSGMAIGAAAGLGIHFIGAAAAGRIPISGRGVVLVGLIALIISLVLNHLGATLITVVAFLGIFGFGTMLSVMNGLFDWASWAVSRHLATSIKDDHSLFKFVTHILLYDTLIAIALLALVPAALIGGFQITNFMLDQFGVALKFNHAPLLFSASNGPFSPNGLWFTLMLLTNLVPTILHLTVAVAGLPLLVIPISMRVKIAQKLRTEEIAHGLIVISLALGIGLATVIAGGWGINKLITLTGFNLMDQIYEMACYSSELMGAACKL
ncbi:MAG: hypothetical protein HN578_10755 [Rhodospirillales bacterium]|jgi:hypothetical protein|nr:hypothetical protein [Rhodospirillales bacterium]MBT3904218.1 hypothetical protein [Rhodospirillaceae bacterium]MBT5034791.1 hypothetical protein [Rhodospirillaceae bacterium]MBT6218328.1 hypothetical protein [Rhodospirillaceae bacterium]MBT6363997.1 hypothetical protein [Rhodospirillaceae bacterium]